MKNKMSRLFQIRKKRRRKKKKVSLSDVNERFISRKAREKEMNIDDWDAGKKLMLVEKT